MNIKEFLQSKTFTKILYGIGACVVVLGIFELGMVVGFQKARFSYRVSDSYGRSFRDDRTVSLDRMKNEIRGPFNFDSAHGAVGTIQQIQNNRILIVDYDHNEKVIVVTKNTIIRKGSNDVSLKDIYEGDNLTVIGAPGADASLNAKFIRVMPSTLNRKRSGSVSTSSSLN